MFVSSSGAGLTTPNNGPHIGTQWRRPKYESSTTFKPRKVRNRVKDFVDTSIHTFYPGSTLLCSWFTVILIIWVQGLS